MPNLGLGSPNASIPKMRPEPVSFNNRFAVLGDDASSIGAVADDDSSYHDGDEGEKKRHVTRKQNRGATKKIKAEWAVKRHHTSQAQLPDMFLSMRDDANYKRIMYEEFKKLEGEEFDLSAEKKMGREMLQKLMRDYRLCSSDGSSLEDSVALQKIRQCLRNKYNYMMKKSQPYKTKPKILLHMQKDETFKSIMTGFFKQSSCDESWEEMANEALHMLKQNYHILDKDGHDIDDKAALNTLVLCIRNRHYREKEKGSGKKLQPSTTTPDVFMNNIVLDETLDTYYRDTFLKVFNDYQSEGYSSTDTSKTILLELQRSLGKEGKFLKKSGRRYLEVSDEVALRTIHHSVTKMLENGRKSANEWEERGSLDILHGKTARARHHDFLDGEEQQRITHPLTGNCFRKEAQRTVGKTTGLESSYNELKGTFKDDQAASSRNIEAAFKLQVEDENPFAGIDRFSNTVTCIQSSYSSAKEDGDDLRIEFFGHLNDWLRFKSEDNGFVHRFKSDDIDRAVASFTSVMEKIESTPSCTDTFKNLAAGLVYQARQRFPLIKQDMS